MIRAQLHPAADALYFDMTAAGTGSTLECAAAAVQGRSLSSYAGSSVADAPAAAGSSSISFKVSGDANNVVVDVKAGKASAKASYPGSSIRQ
jgi:hypothetical protein